MRAVAAALLFVAVAACATAPEVYTLPSEHYLAQQVVINDGRSQVEQGQPNKVLDGLSHYLLSLPVKLLLWNWQMLDHDLPDDSRLILDHYLALNGMRSVKVRHNQYDPIGEFGRLQHNTEVGAGYRYTLGLFLWLRYTLLPDRIFAGVPFLGVGDHFNPYTNTINVYSSDVTVLLHEAGHAKDYLQRDSKGTTFALLRMLPGIDMIQEARATNDAVRFFYCVRDTPNELRSYNTLIPAYSTYIAGYFSGGLVLTGPIVFAGHVTGRMQGRARGRALTLEAEAPPEAITRADFLPEFCQPIEEWPLEDTLPAYLLPDEYRKERTYHAGNDQTSGAATPARRDGGTGLHPSTESEEPPGVREAADTR